MKGKKFLGLLAALTVTICSGAFASGKVGIGVQGGFVPGFNTLGDVTVTFKIPKVPPVFAANVGIWDGMVHKVGATADWWLGNPNITGVLNWFYGPGLAAGVTIDTNAKNSVGVYAGGRFVAGLNVWIVDFLEVYAQAAVQLGIDTYNLNFRNNIFDWGIPLNAGIRFWF